MSCREVTRRLPSPASSARRSRARYWRGREHTARDADPNHGTDGAGCAALPRVTVVLLVDAVELEDVDGLLREAVRRQLQFLDDLAAQMAASELGLFHRRQRRIRGECSFRYPPHRGSSATAGMIPAGLQLAADLARGLLIGRRQRLGRDLDEPARRQPVPGRVRAPRSRSQAPRRWRSVRPRPATGPVPAGSRSRSLR